MMRYLLNLALIALSVLLFQVAHAASNNVKIFPYNHAAGSSYFLLDNFNEASDTEITSHAPDTGGSWSSNDTDETYVQSGEARNTVSNNNFLRNAAVPSSSDFSVSATANVNSTSGSDYIGPCFFVNSTFSGYCGIVDGTGSILLIEYNNGAFNTNHSNSQSVSGFSNTTEYRIELVKSGTTYTLTVYEGVTSRGTDSLTDSTHSPDRAGFLVGGTYPRLNTVAGE